MDYPFSTDGCSGGMSWLWYKVTKKPAPWEGICIEHDRAYWAGGTRADRRRADTRLMSEVALFGHPWLAIAMFIAVRVGGHPLLPTSWRWGYGWRYPSLYS